MGKTAGHFLTMKDIDKDPDDARRVQEIEENYQPKQKRTFTSNPEMKRLRDGESCVVDTGSAVTYVIRIGNKLYQTALTEIT